MLLEGIREPQHLLGRARVGTLQVGNDAIGLLCAEVFSETDCPSAHFALKALWSVIAKLFPFQHRAFSHSVFTRPGPSDHGFGNSQVLIAELNLDRKSVV